MQSQQSSRSCVILGVAAAVHEPWGQQSPWNFAKLGTGFAQAAAQNWALGWRQVLTPQTAPLISPGGQSLVHDAVGTYVGTYRRRAFVLSRALEGTRSEVRRHRDAIDTTSTRHDQRQQVTDT